MARLDVTLSGQTVSIAAGESVSIGRDPAADLTIQHELVSRIHAIIAHDGVGWILSDNASTNGLFHRGVAVPWVRLDLRDEVRLGDPFNGPVVSTVTSASASTIEVPQSVAERPGTIDAHTRLAGARAQPFRSISRQDISTQPGAVTISVGSSPENTIVLDDVFVSRQHARLTEVDGGFLVEDLNSLNGSYVNGQLVSSGYLGEGDRLTIGNHDLVRIGGTLVHARQAAAGSGGLAVRGMGYTLRNGKQLLHDIDLDAARGTLTAVIGPSGAGKSTLSRVVTGAVRPTAGGVQFDEFDVHASYEVVRTRIGLVPQDDVLHRTLSVRTALGYAAKLRLPADADGAARRRQVERAVSQLGLEQHTRTRVDKLSGGQRKRASVALELLTEPALLVLDEPTSGLDPALDRQVMQTLRQLADGDRAVLVITHSVAYLDVCDQVLVLAPGGMPAYVGPAEGIAAHFGTADWAEIFARIADHPERAHGDFRRARAPLPEPRREFRTPEPAVRHKPVPWWRQFTTLASRHLSVIGSDLGYLAFLALLPIALGLLALVVPGSHGFTVAEPAFLGEPSQLLALLIVGACFIGSSMSIRDLVSERPIFLREKAVGLSPSAYLASKVLVFGALSWASAAVLTLVVIAGKKPPTFDLVTGSGTIDLFLALGLTASCSALLGLMISALVRSSDQAMPVLIVMLMAQLVLHGGLIPVTGRVVLEQISWLVPARWGFAAAASSTDLETLVPSIDHDALWEHSVGTWWLDASMLVGFGAVFATVALLRIRSSRR